MKKIYRACSRICAKMDKVILGISAVCLGLLTVLIFIQVICRYAFSNSLSWSEEIARYLEVYIVFLCGAYAVGHGQHIAMDLVITHIPPKPAKIIYKFLECTYIFFSLFMLIYSISFMISEKAQRMASLNRVPKDAVYFALPVSAICMLIYSMKLILDPKEEPNV